MRQMLRLARSVVMSLLTLLTRIFPAHYPLLRFPRLLTNMAALGEIWHEQSSGCSLGVGNKASLSVWPLSLHKAVVLKRNCCTSMASPYVCSDTCWHDSRGCEHVWTSGQTQIPTWIQCSQGPEKYTCVLYHWQLEGWVRRDCCILMPFHNSCAV